VLFNSVRTQAGLAYTVSGNWEAPFTDPGLFIAYAETVKPAETVAAMQSVFHALLAQPLADSVVEGKKQERLNNFVFQFASKASQLQRKVVYDMLGLPQDYLQQYQAGVQAVTSDELLAAARQHLHPDEQAVVVVGDAAKLRPGLEGLGMPVDRLCM
jgi:zinc protease